jgi:hypothetical protein
MTNAVNKAVQFEFLTDNLKLKTRCLSLIKTKKQILMRNLNKGVINGVNSNKHLTELLTYKYCVSFLRGLRNKVKK